MILKNFRPSTLIALSFAALSLTALSGTAALAQTELARIGPSVVTLEDFNRRYQENKKFFQFNAPSKEAVLEDIVKRELGVLEARRLGLDKDPAIIERINTVLYQALLDKQLGKELEKIQISDSEARSHYEKNPEIRTSHVFVAVRPGAPVEEVNAARERITRILNEDLKKGSSFAEVAQSRSDGPAAALGGDIDYKNREALDPAYYDAAVKLRSPGKVSGIVRSSFGFHIIKLTAVRPWADADRTVVRRQIFEARRLALFEKYMAGLRGQYKVSVKKDLVRE
jgi:peptidyl-prolyl cis-trans isomerase C/peptidyl-prolyl cis-trans isomerase D